VALVGSRANHRVGTRANTTLAGVNLSAQIAVIARGAVRYRHVLALSPDTVVCGTFVTVVAIARVEALHAARVVHVEEGITVVVPTVATGGISVGAFRFSRVDTALVVIAVVSVRTSPVEVGIAVGVLVGGPRRTGTRLTGIQRRTWIAVVACGAVRFCRIRTVAGRGVACTHIVTLVQSRADDRIGAGTNTGLAGIGLGAEIAVVARGTVGLWRVGTNTCVRVAGTGVVTLV